MAKRQTRRSISVKGVTYQRLKNYCKDKPISDLIERLVAAHLDAEGVPVPKVIEGRPGRPPKVFTEDIISQHFTF